MGQHALVARVAGSHGAALTPKDEPSGGDDAYAPTLMTPPGGPGHDEGGAAAATARPEPLFHIDRFAIERQLGAGGMGVVYAGFDPELARPVAIKVVRGRQADTAAGRLLRREAQAMARLAHPNVVTVYEVGLFEEQVYLVMELVDGQDLGAWLRAQPRRWRDIVGLFVAAGDGLAAAHDAGIIHRDFKPANVLVDGGGRVRVGDFGLARVGPSADELAAMTPGPTPPASPSSPPSSSSSPSSPPSSSSSARTTIGVAGTPAYMAPEQWDGVPDARSDQFAFAVTLHEALFGHRPDDSPASRRGGADDRDQVPRLVVRTLARASARQASDRYPSMHLVLRQLRRALARRRQLVVAAAIGAAMVASAVGAVALTRGGGTDGQGPCAGPSPVVAVWPATAQATLAASASASARTAGALATSWSQTWHTTRQVACRGPVAARAAQLECLDRALIAFQALVAPWRADATLAADAVELARDQPAPAECLTPPARDAPLSPTQRLTLSRLEAIHATVRVGHLEHARAALAKVAPGDVEAHPHLGELAAAIESHLAHDAGELRRAADLARTRATLAARRGAPRRVVEALLARANALSDLGVPAEALEVLAAAEAMVVLEQLERDDTLASYVTMAQARASYAARDLPRVEAVLAPAVERLSASRDPDHRIELAGLLQLVNEVEVERGTPDAVARGIAALERARAIYLELLGPDFHRLPLIEAGLAQAYLELGRPAEAEPVLASALRRVVEIYGPVHVLVGKLTTVQARIRFELGDRAGASRLLAEGREILARHLDPANHDFAAAAELAGELALVAGDWAQARAEFAAAVVVYGQTGVPRGTPSHTGLALALVELGRLAEATPLAEGEAADPSPLDLVVQARLALARGDRDQARSLGAAARAGAAEHALVGQDAHQLRQALDLLDRRLLAAR